jgi:acetylornithine deacetylase/succinyl-diaminopimelate desuccinylase-like protein
MSIYDDLKDRVEFNIRHLALPWTKKFVEIPNTSKAYDPEWETNGLLEDACQLCIDYAQMIQIEGIDLQMHKDPGVSPLLLGKIPATKKEGHISIITYGHLDKQPYESQEWGEGLHPTKPVEKDGYLYGRGSVDDGYNFFTMLAIVKAYQELNIPHDEFILFYECSEESDIIDIAHWINKFQEQIGKPDVMLCLDDGSISRDIFSLTTSLRGNLWFRLKVTVLENSLHSGLASGIVPSSFRIARNLLERIECSKTGQMIQELQVSVPKQKQQEAIANIRFSGDEIHKSRCMCKGVQPVTLNLEELYLNNVWKAQMEVIGQSGIPSLEQAGNVLRDYTELLITLRTPPTLCVDEAFKTIKNILTSDVPYSAKVDVELDSAGNGWFSGELSTELLAAVDKHSMEVFGKSTILYGNGGTIPFVEMLQKRLPQTLLLVTGADLPDSGIHGPNERLDIEFLVKFAKTFACVMVDLCKVVPNNKLLAK